MVINDPSSRRIQSAATMCLLVWRNIDYRINNIAVIINCTSLQRNARQEKVNTRPLLPPPFHKNVFITYMIRHLPLFFSEGSSFYVSTCRNKKEVFRTQ
jgi:hypothetical protein